MQRDLKAMADKGIINVFDAMNQITYQLSLNE